MKFVAPLSLLGLASATPLAQQAKSAAQASATITAAAPTWTWDSAYVADDYYGTLWHYTLSLEEIPNAGENIMSICNGISDMAEGWCPYTEEQAKLVYSDLVVRNFMPNSFAAGVLDETEVDNVPASLQTGYRTREWTGTAGITEVPDPIDNVEAVATIGSNGPHDVYMCGPVSGGKAYLQNQGHATARTIGFVDDTAPASSKCTALGMHNGYGDDFDAFKLKNTPCDETRYVICSDFWKPIHGSTHGGFPVVDAELDRSAADLMKEAFNLMYDPANQPEEVVEEVVEETTEETTEEAASPMKKYGIVGAVVIIAVVAFLVLGKK
jgi:hypothetical protein